MNNFRPCLNYFIGRCNGPCLGNVDEEEYMKMTDEVILFLNNKDDKIIYIIENKMKESSRKMDFESAARFRDQANSLRTLQEKQKIITASNLTDQDIIAMARGIEEVCVQIFFVRGGKIVGREHFIMEDTFNEEKSGILSSFIKQFYIGAAYIPKEIVVEDEIEDTETISKWLETKRGSKVNLIIPRRGD